MDIKSRLPAAAAPRVIPNPTDLTDHINLQPNGRSGGTTEIQFKGRAGLKVSTVRGNSGRSIS